MEETKKTNIKRATVVLPDGSEKNDIYIENGTIKMMRTEVRQGIFSGVYELDADGLFAVPVFCDSGCFWLGSKRTGYELPKLNEREFKRFGFFSFVTTISTDDKNGRLFDQREQVKALRTAGMYPCYFTGGLKDKAYHIGENIYQDICDDVACIGAAVLMDDTAGSIEARRLEKLCTQVEAAAFDTNRTAVVSVLMGDLAESLNTIEDIVSLKSGRERVIVPWFINRNKPLLGAGIRYIQAGGTITLVAGSEQAQLDKDYVPLWIALIRIYEAQSNLDNVLVSSFSGGFLPPHDENTLPQRGELVYLVEDLKHAVREGIPLEEIVKVLCFNPMAAYGLSDLTIGENKRVCLLIIDDALNIKYIVDGEQVISPDSFKTPVLFI